jgi:hypothetical protein
MKTQMVLEHEKLADKLARIKDLEDRRMEILIALLEADRNGYQEACEDFKLSIAAEVK